MAYQVLARKWRPRQFKQIVGQPHIVQALTNSLQSQYLHHAYLFTGTRGVGKTTLARLLAKCLNCNEGITALPCDQCSNCQEMDSGRFIDLYEVDAASRTKVDDTRELLENVPYAPHKGRFKIYLIDEVHMLSQHSFNALLKTLEEPPAHVKFLLATTDPQKLPATILSRCLQFHLLTVPVPQINQHLQNILQQEKIPFDDSATLLISQTADGSIRDALSLLDQSIAYGNGEVLTEDIKKMLGTIDHDLLISLLIAIKQLNANHLFEIINQLNTLGTDFARALDNLLELLHQIAVHQWVSTPHLPVLPEINELALQFTAEEIQLNYQIALLGQRDLAFAPTPRIGFEMTLLRMLAFTPTSPQLTTSASTSWKDFERSTQDHNPQVCTTAPPLAISQQAFAATPKTPVKATPSFLNLDSTQAWHELLPSLNLGGAALLLAQHCQFNQINDNQIELSLNNKHRPFLQDKHKERIKMALQQYFQKEITIHIHCVKEEIETSALIKERNQDQRRQSAIQTLENDVFIQRVKQQFNAKLLKETLIYS